MKRTGWLLGVLILLLAGWSGTALAQLAWDPKEFMGVDEIFPGMKGYGKTVFEGTKVETFDIEVVGVLKRLDFGFDMILIKVTSGPVVDRKLQTVSGMSGSPIYIDDRLIGAYAYGWDFQQEAIAGVTPIASMLECTQPGSVTPPLTGSLVPSDKVMKIGDKLITRIKVAANHTDAEALQAKSDPTTMVMCPVATPLMVNGMPEAAQKPLQKLLDRFNMRQVPGPGQIDKDSPQLEAGSALAVSLMEGDCNLSAVGTVTYVKGDTVLAFGHPMFGLGKTNLPMSVAYVHGIINSSSSSFKLAAPMKPIGTATSDRSFALGGKIGMEPDTLPVSLYLNDPTRNFTRRYAVEMVQNPMFTPFLLYLYVLYSGTTQMGDLFQDEGTFTARTVVSTDKLGDIEQNMVVSPLAGGMFLPMGEFYFLTDMLMMNPYEPVKLNRVSIQMKYAPERNIASIEKVVADRPVARPGETVKLNVRIRPYGKPVEERTISVKVPENASEPAMAVLVVGGAHGMMLKSLLTPPPTAEEGVKGMVRYLTDDISSQSMLTAQILPEPSLSYNGHFLQDVPLPLLELLMYAESGGGVGNMQNIMGGEGEGEMGGARAGADGESGQIGRPTTYVKSDAVPYVLSGGQMLMIAIATEEQVVQSQQGGEFNFGLNVPVLSASVEPGQPEDGDGMDEPVEEENYYASWMTPQQRLRLQWLRESMQMPKAKAASFRIPTLRYRGLGPQLPLSQTLFAPARRQAAPPEATAPEGNAGGDEVVPEDDETATADESTTEDSGDAESGDGEADQVLLTRAHPTWGLTDRKDFLHGKHLGTGVTSKGALVLVPKVRSIFQTTDLVPWKLATTANGTYVAGWRSNKVLHLTGDGKSEVIFPKTEIEKASAVTALTADAAGNLLVATWPDSTVRLLKPDGTIQREWTIATSAVWDLAVTSTGRRFAACDDGTAYLLLDDDKTPLQVGSTLPDKHVFSLAAGANGDLFMATYPRGKVYRLAQNGKLTSVYEARGAVSSMTVDGQGNLYVGTSPTCRIYRIAPDGTQQEVMRGMGRGNHHVLALKMVGKDLYAATGPAGGLYKIMNPDTAEPQATAIFAREDQRAGTEENGDGVTGPESVMVNALAITAKGDLLAAASSPGQVLQLEPRTEGAFLSSVLQTPAVAKWGQLESHAKLDQGMAMVVESRTGQTALPDRTWGKWTPLTKESDLLASDPATFAQIRVRLTGTAAASPEVEYIRLSYQPMNRAPKVTLEEPKPGAFWKGTKEIRWAGNDPDQDELVYTVFVSKDDGKNWRQLSQVTDEDEGKTENGDKAKPEEGKTPEGAAAKPAANAETKPAAKDGKTEPAKAEPKADKPVNGAAAPKENVNAPKEETKPANGNGKPAEEAKPKTQGEARETNISWDTKSTDDGYYRVKIVASDKYARPESALSAEVISGRFIVDNTAPEAKLDDEVAKWDDLKRFQVTDNLTPILGGKFRVDEGPWIALVAEDGVFNSKSEWVTLVSPNDDLKFEPGEHKIQIQVQDSARNLLDRTITLTVPEKPKETAKVLVPPVGEGNAKDLDELMLLSLH